MLEKNTGKVQHLVGGAIVGTAIDLAVNNNSERGLLGIALHPNFPATSGKSPLRGNRVDQFTWKGASLTYDRNLIMLHAYQADGAPEPPGQGDSAQNAAGNHNGGVIRFGADGKLYIIIGDNGRRGWLQNLFNGPTPPTDDDQFGGPEPDNNHLTGVILRLNDDGSVPTDNPFFPAGASIPGEPGANVQKIFAYGIRNASAWPSIRNQARYGSRSTVMTRSMRSSGSMGARIPAGFRSSVRSVESRNTKASRRPGADKTFSSSDGHRQTLRTLHRKPCRDYSCCPARTTAIRNSAGSSPSHQEESDS